MVGRELLVKDHGKIVHRDVNCWRNMSVIFVYRIGQGINLWPQQITNAHTWMRIKWLCRRHKIFIYKIPSAVYKNFFFFISITIVVSCLFSFFFWLRLPNVFSIIYFSIALHALICITYILLYFLISFFFKKVVAALFTTALTEQAVRKIMSQLTTFFSRNMVCCCKIDDPPTGWFE